MVQALKLKMKEQKGFTLIELLAVIVILGIIAAIAIPAINNVIKKSDAKSSAQEGVQIINAAKMFVANESDTAKTAAGIDPVTNLGALDNTELAPYLDRTADKDGFTVTITAGATGKLVYTLSGHTSTPGTTTKTEQVLVDEAK